MSTIDLALGLLAGVLSFLTPETFLLLPLLLCVIGAEERPITLAIGLGLSLVLTGALAVYIGAAFGFDATWLRWMVCMVLMLHGVMLLSRSMVRRLSLFTGGTGDLFDDLGPTQAGTSLRQLLLALFVGANWLPRLGPSLQKTSLMAAGGQDLPLALGTLFLFGLGAALPLIALGRLIRWFSGSGMRRLADGMAGKRLLGLALIGVAAMGLGGFDLTFTRWADTVLPAWIAKLASTF